MEGKTMLIYYCKKRGFKQVIRNPVKSETMTFGRFLGETDNTLIWDMVNANGEIYRIAITQSDLQEMKEGMARLGRNPL